MLRFASLMPIKMNIQRCFQRLTLLIENLRLNYKLGDIAILVRTNKEGQRVADMLLEHNRITDDKTKHIHFISQDGLLLKASSLVKAMIAAFRLAENPLNKVARSILSKELFLLNPIQLLLAQPVC